MKRNLVLYLVGLFFLVVVGGGALIGQQPVPFEAKVPPPHEPEQDVVMYWNAVGEDAPPSAYWLGTAAQDPDPRPMPPQAGTRRIVIGGEGGPWLGVVLDDIDAEKAKELKLTGENGVLIKEVREESPAAKAGLMKDDIIVEFAGEKVRSAAQLRRLVRETPPGRDVTLVVKRAGQTKNLTAKLEARRWGPIPFAGVHVPTVPEIELPEFNVFVPHGGARLGIAGDDLTTQLAAFFGVKQGKGVLVREVTVGSAAEKGGLKAGDVIVAVDGKEVASVGQLRRALAPEKGEPESRKVTLTLVRDKHEQTLTVELEAPDHIHPRPLTRTELGISPEEMKAKAAEIAARAQERAQQWREQAKKFAEQQGEWQHQLQEEMQQLQEKLPNIEKEIRRNVDAMMDDMRTI